MADRIRGLEKHLARLDRMQGPQVAEAARKALFVGADGLRVDIVHSITEGSISGKGHIPSRPGEPPNADTHQLDTSIHVEPIQDRIGYRVVEEAPYAADLEFGNSRIAERPHMRPAAKRQRPIVQRLVSAALAALNRAVG